MRPLAIAWLLAATACTDLAGLNDLGFGAASSATTGQGGSGASGGGGAAGTGGAGGSGGEPVSQAALELVYAPGADGVIESRRYDPIGESWGEPIIEQLASEPVRFVVVPEPPPGADPVLAIQAEVRDTEATVHLASRSGDSWTVEETLIGTNEPDRRGLDLAFERTSGDALVVYADATSQPKFRSRSGGVWSDEQDVTVLPSSAAIEWVELVSAPEGDEISLLFADDAEDLQLSVWDGDAWSAVSLLGSADGDAGAWQSFAAAYQQESGRLLVVADLDGDLRWAIKDEGATELGVFTTLHTFASQHVTLAAEPGGDRIALAALATECPAADGFECEQLAVGIYGAEDGVPGESWFDELLIDTDTGNIWGSHEGARPVTVGWLGGSGVAIVAYGDEDDAGVDWVSWLDGWTLAVPDVAVQPALVDEINLALLAVPNESALLLVTADDEGELWTVRYDDGTWDQTLAGPLASALSGTGVPLSAAFLP